ncbi:hypothetical protein [Streptomyces sp. Mg1]|uniref:hypothetical protein n=1 Tax=Streptomyces sp. Mg1 TaxID=465541 RepID=UPI000A8C3C52|nr:hypothetical protein [Streptomyces sp. Mg1]
MEDQAVTGAQAEILDPLGWRWPWMLSELGGQMEKAEKKAPGDPLVVRGHPWVGGHTTGRSVTERREP